MTIMYKCDRCGREFVDGTKMVSVDIVDEVAKWKTTIHYHYCEFCRTLFFNALSIVNDGTYGGSVKGDSLINEHPPGREDYDPMVRKNDDES